MSEPGQREKGSHGGKGDGLEESLSWVRKVYVWKGR